MFNNSIIFWNIAISGYLKNSLYSTLLAKFYTREMSILRWFAKFNTREFKKFEWSRNFRPAKINTFKVYLIIEYNNLEISYLE